MLVAPEFHSNGNPITTLNSEKLNSKYILVVVIISIIIIILFFVPYFLRPIHYPRRPAKIKSA